MPIMPLEKKAKEEEEKKIWNIYANNRESWAESLLY